MGLRQSRTELSQAWHYLRRSEQRLADPLGADIDDPIHSEHEARYVILGKSERQRLLVIVYAEQEPDSMRIISARRAAA